MRGTDARKRFGVALNFADPAGLNPTSPARCYSRYFLEVIWAATAR